MNMGLGYRVFEYALGIELIITVLIVIVTYVLLLITHIRNRTRRNLEKNIERYFKTLITQNKKFSSNTFPKHWKRMQILFPVMQKMDTVYGANESWKDIKQELLRSVLLPLARTSTHSKRWIQRFMACQIFELAAEEQDQEAIIKLTNDSKPLIFIHSIPAAIKCLSEVAINNVINRMSNKTWLEQPIYLEEFKHAPIEAKQFIIDRINNSKTPETRAVCYNILRQFPPEMNLVDVNKDINSEYAELKLAAIKYITYVSKDTAIPILLNGLKDNHWEVRLVSIHRLGQLQVFSAIHQIASCLHDPVWWIKNSAAEVLKSLGDKGEEALRSNAIELAPIPFDATRHIQNTLW